MGALRVQLAIVLGCGIFLNDLVASDDVCGKLTKLVGDADRGARIADVGKKQSDLLATLYMAQALWFDSRIGDLARSLDPKLFPSRELSQFTNISSEGFAMDAFSDFLNLIRQPVNSEAAGAVRDWLERVKRNYEKRTGLATTDHFPLKATFLEAAGEEPLHIKIPTSIAGGVPKIETLEPDSESYIEIHLPGYEEIEVFLSAALYRLNQQRAKLRTVSSGRPAEWTQAAINVMSTQLGIAIMAAAYSFQSPDLKAHIFDFLNAAHFDDPATTQSLEQMKPQGRSELAAQFIATRAVWRELILQHSK